MKNTYRYWVWGKGYYNFKTFKVYWAYREYLTEQMEVTNFIGKAISMGFKPTNKDFNSQSNWFGVSKQHPDALLCRQEDSKIIRLSLNGIGMPFPSTDKAMELANEGGCKYLCFTENDEELYSNFFGEIPDEEFITNFLTVSK